MSRPAGARPVPPRHVSLCILSGPTWRTPGRAVLRKGPLRGFYQVKQCHERPRTRLVRTGGMRVFDAAARFPHSCTIPNCSLGAYVCGRRYVLVEEACKRVPEPAVPARKGPGARVRKRSLPTHKRARALRGARGKFRARSERSGAHVFQTGRYRDGSLIARHAARSAARATRRVPSAGPSCPKRKAPTSCPAPPLRACRASLALPASRRHLAPREPPRPLALRERLACLRPPASRRRQGARARSCGGRSRAASQAARERLRAVRTTRREEERA